MSRRTLKSDDEMGFLQAAWDDMVETQLLYHVKVKIELYAIAPRGTIRIRASAWKDVGKPLERSVAEWEGQYPTAQANRLHAAVYRATVGIGAACGRAGLPYGEKDSEDTVD